jgi:hypothetical protein
MTKKKRIYNIRRIKQTATYSTQEIAALFNIHKRTVQEWYDRGLPTIDDRRPFLVLGAHLRSFLAAKLRKRKMACRPNEFYCMKCRLPRQSWENLVDLKPLTETKAMIIGLCPICNTTLNKIIARKRLAGIEQIFMVQTAHEADLIGSTPSIVNTDINKVG